MSGVYDLEGARKAGITDADSLSHLASTLNYDLEGARAAGISDADSLNHLSAAKPPAEPVVEKESPEALGGMGGVLGGVAAAGDVIYSKGRPLFRMAEKALGMDSSEPTVKPRTFLSPTDIAKQAIDRRTAAAPDATGSPSAVRNWGLAEHKGEFLGGSEYGEADKIKKEALAFEKANPTKKVLPGSLLAVPEGEAAHMAKQRAELAAQADMVKQAEVQAVAQKRAERLGERANLKGQQNKFTMGKGAAGLVGKAVLPIAGGYEAGAQGAQAYNRLTRPDLTASDAASGGTNIVGSAAGALSMLPGKYRVPAAIVAQGASAVANWLDKRNPRNEEEPVKKADGGLVQLAKGGAAAKKGVEFLGKALKPLQRAPAKTKAEIEAIAQRMAPQELGQFVRAPDKTTSVAGLSKKQYDRELGLKHDIRNVVGTEHLPEMDYHKKIGDVTMMLPGDKSTVADLHSIGDIPLDKKVRLEGGLPYPIHEATKDLGDEPSRLWTSTGQVAKNYMNLGKKVAQEYNSPNVLPVYSSMPQGMGYSQHYADAMLRGLDPAGANLGKLTDMMRTGSFKGKTFPDFPGFENKDQVYDLFQHNPEMRQLFTNRLQVQDVAKEMGLPPTYGKDALHAVSVPSLRNIETGAGGHMIGRLNLNAPMTPSQHGGYIPDRDTGLHIPGEAIARNKYATPYDMQYPDLLNDIRTNPITYQANGRAMIVPEFGRLKMDSPRQIIDQQHADEMAMYNEAMKKLTGKAGGGLVEYLAKGGKVPEAIVKAYKLFKTKQNAPGELYPLFVNANKPVPMNEWVNAEVGPVAASGKVKSKLGELAYRPGWHAGDLPVATHIGGKSEPGLRAPDFRRPDEVWAEVEMPADVDWQTIANQRARLNKAGNPIPSTAHITDAIPEGGHYRYKTSPNMQGNWLIGGNMKVNKVLTDEEVQAINEAAGVADLPRFTKFDEKATGGLIHLANGGQPFNPQGTDYDYKTALAYGMGPTGTGQNAGHWGSVAPTSDDERMLRGLPEDSYVMLKGKNHPTFYKAEAAEQERGSKIVKMGDRYYSIPK